MKTLIWKDTCTTVFTLTLFIIAKIWEQPKCPTTNEWEIPSSRQQTRRMRAHPLLMKTPKSQLTAKQPLTKKTLEPTKKDTLHPKTKKKPQQDGRRGAIVIKSNPVPARWANHKLEDNYTTEVIPQEWKFWAPIRFTSLGVWQQDEESLKNLALKGSGVWSQDFHRTGGDGNSTLGGCTQSLMCTRTQRKKAVTP